MKGDYTKEQTRSHIEVVMKNALFCHLGMASNNNPYVVTVNFGYDDEYIYFHGAQKGKKVDMITDNPNVCFEINYVDSILSNKQACNWGTKYRSIIGYGKVEILMDEAEREKALLAIMYKYSGTKEHEFNEHNLSHMNVYRIKHNCVTTKQSHWKWDE
ncbi:MAG: pyridoxamine 5'-phosphate oxidase [Bacteroidetes bacterium]|nr:pyridoxamine 5'-phosphate oxidase [Bacteroidota bacterium]|tara:strand:- start:194 stop:667 length:474 start_codon:yes stop_codon:yes gene_type:complete